MYKYQDENGRWHFTDKKPKTEHSTVTFDEVTQSPKPALGRQPKTDIVVAKNPWFGPVWFVVLDKDRAVAEVLVPPRSQQAVEIHNQGQAKPLTWRKGLRYRYLLGDPAAKFDAKPLSLPIAPLGKYQITQAFHGQYSHTDPANAYAIDVAMNVGDVVHAAREGVVVWVKDDYHMGGKGNFFMDKANLVRVLHSDGSMAVYAHILLGSAKVVPGQQVAVGAPLAQAGSSGYSTGPHLHFTVQVSNGERFESVPFQLKAKARVFTPKQGDWLSFQ